MVDNLTKEQRRQCMSRIKGKDTSLERLVRSSLHARGYRFRKHIADLPGKPDVVFPVERMAIFVDGDFWHGWRFSSWKDQLSPFWQEKIEKNRRRDQRNFRRLRSQGWFVIRIWQHQIEQDLEAVVDKVSEKLEGLRTKSH